MFNVNNLIKRYKQIGKVSEVAKEFKVDRSTVYRWIKRARTFQKGYLKHTGLKRESRRPRHVRDSILSNEERIAIEETRKKYQWCSQRITGYLKIHNKLHKDCAFSTVYRFLKMKGMIKENGHHRRPRFQDTRHMHLKNTHTIGKLQMDVKYVTPELSGLIHTVYEYAVIDIFSRYKQAIILPELDMDFAVTALNTLLKTLPFKADFIQTDNGLEFQSRFHTYCLSQQLDHHHIHKSTPNENAVIERSFRTDEEEFYFRLPRPPENLLELNQWLQEYLSFYNSERPHLGLNFLTPLQVVANLSNQ